MELRARLVEKPWGRTELPPPFRNPDRRRIGEIWFEHPADGSLPLLAKYIFTSQKLSVQVHPNDEQARQRGLERGKNECWYILDAEDGATIGLGLGRPLTPAQTRAASLDGSIERILDWKPVRRGDFVFVPAGTIHAIGAGISLLEFQQNADVTYRLYDYGRPRELHLEDGVAVSTPLYDAAKHFSRAGSRSDGVLVDSAQFCLLEVTSAAAVPKSLADRRRWVMPLQGAATAGSATVSAGGCLLAEPGETLSLSTPARVLVGSEGVI